MKRESLPFTGLPVWDFHPRIGAGQMSTLGPKSRLSGGRAPIAQHQNFYVRTLLALLAEPEGCARAWTQAHGEQG